jgi:hypothetical protein
MPDPGVKKAPDPGSALDREPCSSPTLEAIFLDELRVTVTLRSSAAFTSCNRRIVDR